MKFKSSVFVLYGSLLLLSGCSEEPPVPTVPEIPVIEEEYSTVLSYIDEKNLKIEEEVVRDSDGNIIDDNKVENEEGMPWSGKNHVSLVHVIPGVKFGVNSIEVEKHGDGKQHEFYIVVDGNLYNTNDKKIAYGVIGNPRLMLGNRTYKLDDWDKENLTKYGVDFFDARDTTLKFEPNSDNNIKLYFVNTSSYKKFDILESVRIRNLNIDLLLREKVYEEDRTEEDNKYVEKQRDLMNSDNQ